MHASNSSAVSAHVTPMSPHHFRVAVCASLSHLYRSKPSTFRVDGAAGSWFIHSTFTQHSLKSTDHFIVSSRLITSLHFSKFFRASPSSVYLNVKPACWVRVGSTFWPSTSTACGREARVARERDGCPWECITCVECGPQTQWTHSLSQTDKPAAVQLHPTSNWGWYTGTDKPQQGIGQTTAATLAEATQCDRLIIPRVHRYQQTDNGSGSQVPTD